MNILRIIGITILGGSVGMAVSSIFQLKNPEKLLKANSNKKKPGQTNEEFLKSYKTKIIILTSIYFLIGIVLFVISLSK